MTRIPGGSAPPGWGDRESLAEEDLTRDCYGGEELRPRPHPPSQYFPECDRTNIRAEVFAYDADRDAWRAAGRRGSRAR